MNRIFGKKGQQYIVSAYEDIFPDFKMFFRSQAESEYEISNKITVVPTFHGKSVFYDQLQLAGADYQLYELDYLLSQKLAGVITEYTLIVTSKNTIIAENLDEQFLSVFNSLGVPFIISSSREANRYLASVLDTNLPIREQVVQGFPIGTIIFGKTVEIRKFLYDLSNYATQKKEIITKLVELSNRSLFEVAFSLFTNHELGAAAEQFLDDDRFFTILCADLNCVKELSDKDLFIEYIPTVLNDLTF